MIDPHPQNCFGSVSHCSLQLECVLSVDLFSCSNQLACVRCLENEGLLVGTTKKKKTKRKTELNDRVGRIKENVSHSQALNTGGTHDSVQMSEQHCCTAEV